MKKLRQYTTKDWRKWRWYDNRWWDTLGNSMSAVEYADLSEEEQTALQNLRANPFVPEPKGLRELISNALEMAYEVGRGVENVDWKGTSRLCDTILDRIDRDRPTLGRIDEEQLVTELKRRGWISYAKADVQYPEPPTGYRQQVARGRRVLIAPERAS